VIDVDFALNIDKIIVELQTRLAVLDTAVTHFELSCIKNI